MEFEREPVAARDALLLAATKWVAACALVLGFFWCVGSATFADEPASKVDFTPSLSAEVEGLRARLAERVDWVAVADEESRERLAREAARDAADIQAVRELDAEAARLAAAMERMLDGEVPGGGARLARRLDVAGFARVLVDAVERRARSSEPWVPLGREKAPAFLAAVAFHESSWRWRDADLVGSRGERCAFQVSRSAAAIVGRSFERVSRDPGECVDAALDVMRLCIEKCGEHPFEQAMGCYATAGTCGGAPDVVAVRFETARRLLP